jgi:hypothetical protein
LRQRAISKIKNLDPTAINGSILVGRTIAGQIQMTGTGKTHNEPRSKGR